MNNLTFKEIKEALLSMVIKIKESDPERGAYLERHIIVDDQNKNITYTGNQEIIKSVGNYVQVDRKDFRKVDDDTSSIIISNM